MSNKRCCITGCGNGYSKTVKECRLFSPPITNKKLLARWTASVNKSKFKLTNNTKVCQQHFKEDCFIKGVYGPEPDGKQVLLAEFKHWRLTDNAVPTLKMGIFDRH